MQQPGPAPVPAGAGRGAGEKRQNQEPHVPPGGKRPAHASGADDNGAFDEDDDGAAAGQQAGGNGGAAGVEPQTPQGPLMSILFPAMVHLNNGASDMPRRLPGAVGCVNFFFLLLFFFVCLLLSTWRLGSVLLVMVMPRLQA